MTGPSRNQPATSPSASPKTIVLSRALGIGIVAVALVAVVSVMATYVAVRGSPAAAASASTTPLAVPDAPQPSDGQAEQLAAAELRISALEEENATLVDDHAADAQRVERLRASIEALRAEREMLRRQIAELTEPTDPMRPSVEYGAALRYAENWFDGRQYLLVLDVLVENPHDGEAYFTPSDFELKAPDSTRYAILAESAVASQPRFVSGVESLPAGRVEIESQLLDPGESVRGSIVFYVTDPDLPTFTVDYHGTAATISPR